MVLAAHVELQVDRALVRPAPARPPVPQLRPVPRPAPVPAVAPARPGPAAEARRRRAARTPGADCADRYGGGGWRGEQGQGAIDEAVAADDVSDALRAPRFNKMTAGGRVCSRSCTCMMGSVSARVCDLAWLPLPPFPVI